MGPGAALPSSPCRDNPCHPALGRNGLDVTLRLSPCTTGSHTLRQVWPLRRLPLGLPFAAVTSQSGGLRAVEAWPLGLLRSMELLILVRVGSVTFSVATLAALAGLPICQSRLAAALSRILGKATAAPLPVASGQRPPAIFEGPNPAARRGGAPH